MLGHMSVKITYFVHGTTTDNEKELASGWNPGELSKSGITQAEELGRLVVREKFDAVFCSDLKRAYDSARLAFGDKYEIIPDARLRECNYGDFNGRPEKEFVKEEYIINPFPHGESYKDVEKRVTKFLEFIRSNFPNQRIAIMAHQAPQLALEVLVNGKTWDQAFAQDWRKTKAWQPGWVYRVK